MSSPRNLAEGTIINAPQVPLPAFTSRYPNLASAELGASVVSCSDEFFAACERMLQDTDPVFVAGKFDDNGKWMDGWETRRRRQSGHDEAIIKLGLAGVIHGVDMDTSHFTGNFPPAASIQAAHCDGTPDQHTTWTEIVGATSLQGNAHHFVSVDESRPWTHV
ncbi:MAG: allantoicase, partial [Xanthomonadales bacterium]|nr:allantoicase [Xanthomonadales bacterium]